MTQNIETDLVRYSRAGDHFHYRWAARRCLQMLHPKSNLQNVVIEGSKEREGAGEYVIDVAEYAAIPNSEKQKATYYQLKHSTKRAAEPFNLSDLRDTIEGFARRYRDIMTSDLSAVIDDVKFIIVTNRVINSAFKEGVNLLMKGEDAPKRFQNTIIKYTSLKGNELQKFCARLELCDGEGDYIAQRHQLHCELASLLADSVDTAQIESVIALVIDRALPKSDGEICQEDILSRFGFTSIHELFPAPAAFETLTKLVTREQHADILKKVIDHQAPTIIKASGGVGKSVFALQLADSLPTGSLAITYDCFGAGKYRNRSTTRHMHRHALVQIINEIATHGFCEPIIPISTDQDDALMRKFMARLQTASEQIANVADNAILAIIVDAADNAEMAAEEFSESCFASQLLAETVPGGCRIVALCRPERVHLLKPRTAVQQIVLKPFSEKETELHLKGRFAQASKQDCIEFHRLTNGNPRVQANVLVKDAQKVTDVLVKLGPGATVDEQIEAQLNSAINELKDSLPNNASNNIDTICVGLANLPPFIPLKVLSVCADVTIEAIQSFIADLGRPLWLTNNAVQFRDEPTETWFRKQFAATATQISLFVERLKPLAADYPYIAESLPSLLLQAEQYDELINLALSDDCLPSDNPIDARNIRTFRLQFAFKAAMKRQQNADSIKLALLAGEEVAGESRQLKLLNDNVDLIAPLQSSERVQELAYRRLLSGEWDGSENVYSASLLSCVDEFKGEARGYLRSAWSWLNLYFEARKEKDEYRFDETLKDRDIVELTYAQLNISGVDACVDELLSWTPAEVGFHIAGLLVKKLIDVANFDLINDIAIAASHNQYVMLALTDKLMDVGHYPPKSALATCLDLLNDKKTRIKPDDSPRDNAISTSVFISFAEACIKSALPTQKVLCLARFYFKTTTKPYIASHGFTGDRDSFLRSITLLALMQNKAMPTIEELVSRIFNENDNNTKYHQSSEYRRNKSDFEEVIGALLPWYSLRAKLIHDSCNDFADSYKQAQSQSARACVYRWAHRDLLPFEISEVKFELLKFATFLLPTDISPIIEELTSDKSQLRLHSQISALCCAYRMPHLYEQAALLEQDCYEQIEAFNYDGPEAKADDYILLARAVMANCQQDAAAYFDLAIEAMSKFGDELFYRWKALVALAKRSKDSHTKSAELPYRFIRCAELVGDNFDREKYWDRNEAIKTCAELCPKSAIAALSRWRERDVGWLDRQLPELASKLLTVTDMNPAAFWALTRFGWEYDKPEFAIKCIELCEPTVAKSILDMIVNDLRVKHSPEAIFEKLALAASNKGIKNEALDETVQFFSQEVIIEPQLKQTYQVEVLPVDNQQDNEKGKKVDWDKLFESLHFETSEGIAKAAAIFDNIPYPRCSDTFWQQVCKRVDNNKAVDFLYALSITESVSLHDISDAIGQIRKQLLNKISVKKAWPNILKNIGKTHAVALVDIWRREAFLESCDFIVDVKEMLHKGITIGLAQTHELSSASTFWGYVQFAVNSVTPEEATTLLEFGLSRFELHMDENVADGPWSEWLRPPDNFRDTFTGFIWSALGSPRAEMRWQAAHCVRALAATDCQSEIDSLIGWMTKDKIGALGSQKFPFYVFHARQYLLVALARIAIDKPQILAKHAAIFEKLALMGDSHVFIQQYSRDIALAIEVHSPNTYTKAAIDSLKKLGKSQLPVKDLRGQNYRTYKSWPTNETSDVGSEFLFGLDLPEYWFEPLGRVFGISQFEIEKLVRNVIVDDWQIPLNDGEIEDPRKDFWRSRNSYSENWQRKGDYPKTDDYRFYLSYHAMLTIAAKLIKTKSVVQEYDYDDNKWIDWLSRHLLTKQDGSWLADSRDHIPLQRRPWIYKKLSKQSSSYEKDNWRWMISAKDFLEGLFIDKGGEPWLNLWGEWNEVDGDYIESFLINSALVSPATAKSLLYSLQSCKTPYDFKLPVYDEESFEIDEPAFKLSGWIVDYDYSSRLDKFDSAAADIEYPPLKIADGIAQTLNLRVDKNKRYWLAEGENSPKVISELWSSHNETDDDDTALKGKRISASLSTLKKLCSILSIEVIFEVQVKRYYKYNSYLREKEDVGNFPPNSKIFILSADGKLRDYRETYQIREANR